MPESLQLFAIVVAGLAGANIGSFLNVCIYRVPRDGLSVSRPRRSFCPSCGTWIAWYDNIPLVSWLFLGGRCRFCGAPISVRYFLVEALTAALFTIVAARYLGGDEAQWGAFVAVVALVAALIVASFIDIELRILPDEITLGGTAAVPFVALLVPDLHTHPVNHQIAALLYGLQGPVATLSAALPDFLKSPVPLALTTAVAAGIGYPLGLYGYALYWRLAHPRDPKPLRDGWLGGVLVAALCGVTMAVSLWPQLLVSARVYSFTAAFAGLVVGSTLVLLVGVIGSKVFRKPAMGFGDVKLMALLGGFTGWTGVISGFFVACLLGSVVGIALLLRYRSRYIPFGPFLAAGALVMLLCPEFLVGLWKWYLGLF